MTPLGTVSSAHVPPHGTPARTRQLQAEALICPARGSSSWGTGACAPWASGHLPGPLPRRHLSAVSMSLRPGTRRSPCPFWQTPCPPSPSAPATAFRNPSLGSDRASPSEAWPAQAHTCRKPGILLVLNLLSTCCFVQTLKTLQAMDFNQPQWQ